MASMRLTGAIEGALHNSNVSDEAKKADRAKLRELKKSGALDDAEAHLKNVERGHKVSMLGDILLSVFIQLLWVT